MRKFDLLAEVAEATRLREGDQGVRQLLLTVYQKEGLSTKACARQVRLPVPLVAALKKELIKRGVLQESNGMWLTPKGRVFCQDNLGIATVEGFICPECEGTRYLIPHHLRPVLDKVEHYLAERPKVDVTLDQSQCTAKTSLRRAILALEYGALWDSQVAFVGDDDCVSLSAGLLLKHLISQQEPFVAQSLRTFTVFDIDKRFLKYIDDVAKKEGLPINTVFHDLRQPMPRAYRQNFGMFFTDPPYTLAGCNLFVSRGVELLRRTSGLNAFLSYAHKSPEETLAIQQQLGAMGLVFEEILPSFNHYIGAEMIGNRSQMMVLKTTTQTQVTIPDSYEVAFYTGERKPNLRTYVCKGCEHPYTVGAGQKYQTIEALKTEGCSHCQGETFERQTRNLSEKRNGSR